MHHGDEVTIVNGSPRIPVKSIEPIGICDKSTCWGVWITDRRVSASRGEAPKEKPPASRKSDLPSLLISPIHPTLWPSVFHAEIRLEDVPGTIERSSGVFYRQEVNILFEEFVKAGYKHSVWNVVANAEPLRSRIQNIVANRYSEAISLLSPSIIKQELDRITALHSLKGALHANAYSDILACLPDVIAARLSSIITRERSPEDMLCTISDTNVQWDILRAVGRCLLEFLCSLRQEFCEADNAAARKNLEMLYKKFANIPSQPPQSRTEWSRYRVPWSLFEKDFDSDPALKDLYHLHKWDVCVLRGMPQLASFWVFGTNTRNPIQFTYDAQRALLQADDSRALRDGMQQYGELGTEVPTRAIACFDRDEYFVRLFFLDRRTVSRHVLCIDLNYAASESPRVVLDEEKRTQKEPLSTTTVPETMPTPAGTAAQPVGSEASASRATTATEEPSRRTSSRGLLHFLCSSLKNATGINLMRVTNRITEWRDGLEERGQLHLVGQVSLKTAQEFIKTTEDVIRGVPEKLNKPEDWKLSVASFKVVTYPHARVFISVANQFVRRVDVVPILKEIAAAEGIEPVFAETYTGSATENVVAKIGECDAFLQLVTLRESEHERLIEGRDLVPDFGWLHYEYGLADALQRRPVRVIDKNVPKALLERYARIRRDTANKYFDTMSSGESIKADLDAAMQQVVSVIYGESVQRT